MLLLHLFIEPQSCLQSWSISQPHSDLLLLMLEPLLSLLSSQYDYCFRVCPYSCRAYRALLVFYICASRVCSYIATSYYLCYYFTNYFIQPISSQYDSWFRVCPSASYPHTERQRDREIERQRYTYRQTDRQIDGFLCTYSLILIYSIQNFSLTRASPGDTHHTLLMLLFISLLHTANTKQTPPQMHVWLWERVVCLFVCRSEAEIGDQAIWIKIAQLGSTSTTGLLSVFSLPFVFHIVISQPRSIYAYPHFL